MDRTPEIDMISDHHEQGSDSERHQQRGVRRFTGAARQLNRHPRLVSPARRAREWVMGEDQIADRLASVLPGPTDLAVRELAALGSQSRGLSCSTPSPSSPTLLREVTAAIEPPILQRGGEVVKRLGDALMAAFRDAQSATEAAFDARERAAVIAVDGYRPQLRTGIHLGRPRKISGDYFGVDVNIAARLLEAAKPGEILVCDRTLQALDAATVTARKRRFSAMGVPTDLGAHVVKRPPDYGTPRRPSRKATRRDLLLGAG